MFLTIAGHTQMKTLGMATNLTIDGKLTIVELTITGTILYSQFKFEFEGDLTQRTVKFAPPQVSQHPRPSQPIPLFLPPNIRAPLRTGRASGADGR